MQAILNVNIHWHWYWEGPLEPRDIQSYLLSMLKLEPFKLETAWGPTQELTGKCRASCGFPGEKAQQREVEGETEEVGGKRERIGMEKCKGKELTKWWNWNLVKTKEAWLRPFVCVPFLLFLLLFSPATCSPKTVCTEYLIPVCRLADKRAYGLFWCPHQLLFRQHFPSKWLSGRSVSRRMQALSIWLSFPKVLKQY